MPPAPHTILKFSDIIGQEKAKELLKRSASRNKMSHAFLFRGAAGIGKKTTAKAFAACINCLAPENREACGTCTACRKLGVNTHPDYLVIAPEGASIKIDQVRELRQLLAFPPYEGRYRIALLADVHTMRREAANSLLKTLEEPPPNTVLILTGDEAAGILPTIVSRCQGIPFYPLTQEQVAVELIKTRNLDVDQARGLAEISEGSLGRAQLLLDEELLAVSREIIAELCCRTPDDPQTIETVYRLAETAAKLKENLHELFELLKSWLHGLALAAHGVPEKAGSGTFLHPHPRTGEGWNLTRLSVKLQKITEAQRQLNRNCNRTLVCEVLFFGLLQ